MEEYEKHKIFFYRAYFITNGTFRIFLLRLRAGQHGRAHRNAGTDIDGYSYASAHAESDAGTNAYAGTGSCF